MRFSLGCQIARPLSDKPTFWEVASLVWVNTTALLASCTDGGYMILRCVSKWPPPARACSSSAADSRPTGFGRDAENMPPCGISPPARLCTLRLPRHSRRTAVQSQIAQLGDMRPGSITGTGSRCANPNCHCHRTGDPGHGPYYRQSDADDSIAVFDGAGGTVRSEGCFHRGSNAEDREDGVHKLSAF
jgi:hypothetical protein